MILWRRTDSSARGLQHVGGALALLVAIPLATACGTDRVDAGEASDASRSSERGNPAEHPHADHHDDPAHMDHSSAPTPSESLGTLSSETPDGIPVHLTLDPDPPSAGPVLLQIRVEGELPDPDALTADLVAPHMPAHGIVRFPVKVTGDGQMEADIRIPMEGTWKVYVNLDSGAQAAPFQFQVAPGEDDHGHSGHDHHDHQHHGSAPDGGDET